MITITIDERSIQVEEGTTILEAARKAEIYIPTICHHPDLKSVEKMKPSEFVYQGPKKIIGFKPDETVKGCGLCLVAVQGLEELQKSCQTKVADGMVVTTSHADIKARRKENLLSIMARHPHACLLCQQQEGCDRIQCSLNVPVEERCCSLFGHCELQKVAQYIGIDPATPRWIPTQWPVLKGEPLFERNYNLCIGCLRCVRACNDLREVGALQFVFDEAGAIQVGSLSPTLKESECRFCTTCVGVCPTGALMDKNIRSGHEEEDLVPCQTACPAHIDIPGYLRLIAHGRTEEAIALIREKVPFPGILGRTCIRPCEKVCRRGEINEPVSICALKRFVADNDQGEWKKAMTLAPPSGHKVAVVGSGPAGLTAAFYLKKCGHHVTIFESKALPGGMLRYAIPEYRLPMDIVEREIQEILDIGVKLEAHKTLGKDFTIDLLKKNGYEAIFLATGAQKSRKIEIEGSHLKDVLWGLDLLSDLKKGEEVTLKEKVVIIGGGNVAVDAALTSLRCGASQVTMVCLEKREEMPADEWEIDQLIEEGVSLINGWGPDRILSKSDLVTGIEFKGCPSVFNDKGHFSPIYDDRRMTLKADQIIFAIGQSPDLSFLPPEGPIRIEKGLVVVDPESLETDMPGVFAGGDMARYPGSIIHAIADGKRAASSIDKFLGGNGYIEETLAPHECPSSSIGRIEAFAYLAREKIPIQPVKSRKGNFKEVLLGYQSDQAKREAGRCLLCHLRLHMASPPAPPEKWLTWNRENIDQVPEKEGVYQLLDTNKKVLFIKGTRNMKEALINEFAKKSDVAFFDFEEDPLYSKRESELIQQHLQRYGEMPGAGADDLDELF